jgi:leucyl-tRNA synthetase
MLAAFAPHFAEEIWSKMNEDGFVSFAKWPEPDKGLIRDDAEELELIIKTCMEDVQSITKVTSIKPKTVHFYTADGWKWKMYLKAAEMQAAGKLDIGALIRESFKDDEMKTKQKEVPAYSRVLVEELKKIPENTLKTRVSLGQINESRLLQDALSFLKAELGCDVTVNCESDPWIDDPSKRANRAKPYRPAIYVA